LGHVVVLLACRNVAEYFPIDLPFPRALPIKTTDEFGAYARRIQLPAGSNLVHPEQFREK
jgi:NitT/TauT family transport system ATP-binding protein